MLNRVEFIGYLGRDPDTRYAASGAAICNFSVASTEKWKDKASGEAREQTEWLKVSAFDKLAEICGQWLKKGSLVFVAGKLVTRKWQDKDGKDCYTTECRLIEMKMLGGRERSNDDGERQERPAAAPSRASAQKRNDTDDDIPF